MSSFHATVTDARLAIDTDDHTDDPLELLVDDETVPFTATYDGTAWETTPVSWPSPAPDIEVPLAEFDIDVSVAQPLTGTLDRQANQMTASLALDIGIEVSIAVVGIDATLHLDSSLTTAQSGDMNGTATGLDTESATVTLVDNELTIPTCGEEKVDDLFGLPSETPGRNSLILTLDIDFPETE